MAWSTSTTRTTAHTCGGPVFGRKTPGCPRCDELLAGAAPVVWAPSRDARDCADLAAHYASHKHRSGECGGPMCTYGTW